jgi:glycosyltransferase involved in cell wall biosynthesis
VEHTQRRVVIVQPYVPVYRVPFFDRLHTRLNHLGIRLDVVHGKPVKGQAARGDEASLEFASVTRSFEVEVFGRPIRWRHLGRHIRGSDLVVSELASGALENYWLALRPATRQALWGHGYATTSPPNRLDSLLERWLMRRADHLFLYTERGRAVAAAAGIRSDVMTVLNNTVDTAGIETAVHNLSQEDVSRYRTTHELGEGPCCAFVGSVDKSKRIDFLMEAGSRLAERVPGFRLIVAGDGAARDEVALRARTSNWLRYVGRVGDEGKALLAKTCSLLLNPGRVGLVAVDSFAMRTPVVTTTWPRHAPEFEYLVDGENAVITADSLDAYVAGVVETLNSPTTLRKLVTGCEMSAVNFSIDAMVDRFVEGVTATLDRESRRQHR